MFLNTQPLLNRRTALKTALTGVAMPLFYPVIGRVAKKTKLSFSTLGCPKWDLALILQTAQSAGYQGVEFRGLQGELDLTKCPAFSSSTRATETRNQFADQGIQICNLGSSAQLHHADPPTRSRNLDEAKRYIGLAHQLNCPYVRVFPDSLPANQSREKTLGLISEGLVELGNYAQKSSVTVLLESHGELTRTELLAPLMQSAEHPNVGMIWDIFNMWADARESPATVYRTLKKYIRHVHVKDARLVGTTHQYVQIGSGEAPLHEAIDALKTGGFAGYYSFEWEKLWHPEIAEPEQVIPFYPAAMKAYL